MNCYHPPQPRYVRQTRPSSESGGNGAESGIWIPNEPAMATTRRGEVITRWREKYRTTRSDVEAMLGKFRVTPTPNEPQAGPVPLVPQPQPTGVAKAPPQTPPVVIPPLALPRSQPRSGFEAESAKARPPIMAMAVSSTRPCSNASKRQRKHSASLA